MEGRFSGYRSSSETDQKPRIGGNMAEQKGTPPEDQDVEAHGPVKGAPVKGAPVKGANPEAPGEGETDSDVEAHGPVKGAPVKGAPVKG
jgi:hypothetical protein